MPYAIATRYAAFLVEAAYVSMTVTGLLLGEPAPYGDPAERKAKRNRDRIRANRSN
ncbi:hypothetical protein ACFYWN_00370 [Streptomyces sp. NPDC002917]|uniref:hypothetical protein n=1 Tax=Streptomyces sp. NPDC002917 TaxID=3364671 RepID=UPI0036BB4D7B